jgi:osmotically-inducible protein OsmY
MKTNEDLQKDVQNAIKWESLLNESEIGVNVKEGVITLTGVVDNYSKKIEAENAAKKVTGVKAVVENIEIAFGSSYNKSDTEIANEILHAWKWNWQVPNDNIHLKIENGWVIIDGEVEWNYQKEAAKKSIVNLSGIKGITNNVHVKLGTCDSVEKTGIKHALDINLSIDNGDIQVEVSGNNVRLNGMVYSLYQKDEAERIAWNAPGVRSVNNEILIGHGD